MSENEQPPHIFPPDGWDEMPQDLIDAVQAAPTAKIIIDASAAKAISTQSAQLLLALKASAEGLGTEFRLQDASDAATKSLQTLGLDHQLLEPHL